MAPLPPSPGPRSPRILASGPRSPRPLSSGGRSPKPSSGVRLPAFSSSGFRSPLPSSPGIRSPRPSVGRAATCPATGGRSKHALPPELWHEILDLSMPSAPSSRTSPNRDPYTMSSPLSTPRTPTTPLHNCTVPSVASTRRFKRQWKAYLALRLVSREFDQMVKPHVLQEMGWTTMPKPWGARSRPGAGRSFTAPASGARKATKALAMSRISEGKSPQPRSPRAQKERRTQSPRVLSPRNVNSDGGGSEGADYFSLRPAA